MSIWGNLGYFQGCSASGNPWRKCRKATASEPWVQSRFSSLDERFSEADGSRQRGPGSCARASFAGWCVCVVQRGAGRGVRHSTTVPSSNTAVTQENQLNSEVPSFPSRSKLGTVRAEIPPRSALESGPGHGQGKQVKGRRLQQQGWGRTAAEQGLCHAAAQHPQEG